MNWNDGLKNGIEPIKPDQKREFFEKTNNNQSGY